MKSGPSTVLALEALIACTLESKYSQWSSLYGGTFLLQSSVMTRETGASDEIDIDRQLHRPSFFVVKAFGVQGDAVGLAGGQGSSVRVGDAVFKPVGDNEEDEWSASLLDSLHNRQLQGFRVPRPLPVVGGTGYTFHGWRATSFVPGEPGPAGRWKLLLASSRAFHDALRGVSQPDYLQHRSHPWAVADRVAWEGNEVSVHRKLRPLFARLSALRRPVGASCQLVHGDLSGNVLFHAKEAPAIIDFSPYWRPVSYAEAIVVADGLLWYEAGQELVEIVGTEECRLQMLVRAIIFRLIAWNGLYNRAKIYPLMNCNALKPPQTSWNR